MKKSPVKTRNVRVRAELLDKAKAVIERATETPVGDLATVAAGCALVIGRHEGRYHTSEEVGRIVRFNVANLLSGLLKDFLGDPVLGISNPVHVHVQIKGEDVRVVVEMNGETSQQVPIPVQMVRSLNDHLN